MHGHVSVGHQQGLTYNSYMQKLDAEAKNDRDGW